MVSLKMYIETILYWLNKLMQEYILDIYYIKNMNIITEYEYNTEYANNNYRTKETMHLKEEYIRGFEGRQRKWEM